MSGTEASEDNESSDGFKKQNFDAEADLADMVMHDSEHFDSRRYWAECVATITSPSWLQTDEGDMVNDRPISCLIQPKSRDDAATENGELSFSPALQGSDGDYLTQNKFGLMLILSESEFQRFWDYQFGHWKPTVSAMLRFRGHFERDHLVLGRLIWKTQDYTGEGRAYLKILSVSLDYQWGDKSSEST